MNKNLLGFLALTLFTASCTTSSEKQSSTWQHYLGGLDRNHYSTLEEITPDNVNQLKIAWSYSLPDSGQMQTNPIIVDSIMYVVSPTLELHAIHAATGKKLWSYADTSGKWNHVNRGVSYWEESSDKRVFIGIGQQLHALNALTGEPITSFANQGKLDLRAGLPDIAKDKYVVATTPPTIFKNLMYLSIRTSEDTDGVPGDIRAIDVKTGELKWTFHTIPYPNEENYKSFPGNTYLNTETGGANNWSGMTVDEKRDLLFVPTGSVSYDFYGGNRAGNNLYANTLLAIDAETGIKKWHYQFIRHDLWDRDLPAPPNLIQVTHNGKKIDAVAQVTKHGYVFVFNRDTGEPLFPIDELEVPTEALAGEWIAPTQPIPQKPAPYARQGDLITETDINIHADNRDELIKQFKKIDKRQFAPPNQTGTLIFPGFDGGAEWGGAAADPENGILYVNSNEMPWILTMVESPKEQLLAHLSLGERMYQINCSSCHQTDKSGAVASGYPSLIGIEKKTTQESVAHLIRSGKGMMPGFTHFSKEERDALIAYLFNEEQKEATPTGKFTKKQLPYKSTGYHKFLAKNGLPAIGPPWGTLNAIDLNTGEYLWKIPLGEVDSLAKLGVPTTGIENYGGPLITKNGLLAIAATKDSKFRIFDRHTGKLLWETTLPAPAFATPSTYSIKGKQYIVLACGGTKLNTKKGNQYIAFSL